MSWQDVRSFYEDPEDEEYDFKLLGKTEQAARKWHTCEHCQGGIAPGQRYESIRALDEGRFTILKYHTDRDQCRAAELAREEEERWQSDVMAEMMGEEWVREHAHKCGRCQGWGDDLQGGVSAEDWISCRRCGGAGQWDSGEAFPAAFDMETTEPRIPADLTNLYRPHPRKAPVVTAVQPYDENNVPF